MYRKVLCAIDFSPGSQVAVRCAAEQAAEQGGSLTLIHVNEPFRLALPPELQRDAHFLPSVKAHQQLLLRELQADAGKLVARPVEALLVEGVAWERVTQVASEGRYDLIVVGSRGHSGQPRAPVGSVAERIVRHAPCDVLVARS